MALTCPRAELALKPWSPALGPGPSPRGGAPVAGSTKAGPFTPGWRALGRALDSHGDGVAGEDEPSVRLSR